MHTFSFTKSNGAWHIDSIQLPFHEYASYNVPLQEGAETILNLLSGNGSAVTIDLDTEPFDNADVLELMQLCHPFLEGGYYYMYQYAGQAIHYQIWMCDVPKYAFGAIPARIYLRRS